MVVVKSVVDGSKWVGVDQAGRRVETSASTCPSVSRILLSPCDPPIVPVWMMQVQMRRSEGRYAFEV